MSGFFSSSARAFIRFIGLDQEKLPSPFKNGLEDAIIPGGKAEQVSFIFPMRRDTGSCSPKNSQRLKTLIPGPVG
jgi:hypothetical protein